MLTLTTSLILYTLFCWTLCFVLPGPWPFLFPLASNAFKHPCEHTSVPPVTVCDGNSANYQQTQRLQLLHTMVQYMTSVQTKGLQDLKAFLLPLSDISLIRSRQRTLILMQLFFLLHHNWMISFMLLSLSTGVIACQECVL